jgi:hypothetical protein
VNLFSKGVVDHKSARAVLISLYFSAWSICLGTLLFRNLSGNYVFPKTSFLNDFVTRFGDWYGTHDHWIRLGWGNIDYGLSYFPAAYFVHTFFWKFMFTPQDAMKVIHVVAFLSIYLIIRDQSGLSKSQARTLFLLFCSTYPLILAFSTGNLELLFFVPFIYSFFVIESKPKLAAVLLGFAAAPKMVLVIFAFLFFCNRKTKDALKLVALTLLFTIITNFVAILVLPRGIAQNGFGAIKEIFRGTLESIKLYESLMIYSSSGLHFSHSILNGVHVFFGMDVIISPMAVFSFSIVLLSLNLLFVMRIIRLGSKKSHLGLAIALTLSLSLPTSTDYRLIYVAFFFLLIVFELYLEKCIISYKQIIGLMLIMLALVPKPYFYLAGDPYLGMNVWLTPILLALGQIVLALDPFVMKAEVLQRHKGKK